jgi:hypothetical protein
MQLKKLYFADECFHTFLVFSMEKIIVMSSRVGYWWATALLKEYLPLVLQVK